MDVKVTTYKLEMARRPTLPARERISSTQVELPSPTLNRYFYTSIGYNWLWFSKFHWSYQQWLEIVTADGHETWVAYCSGTPVGYFELKFADASVEVAYFGLLAEFAGQGLGGELIRECLDQCWRPHINRVWLNTCSLDHPAALPNYLKAGFSIVEEVTGVQDIPDEQLAPWPEAGLMPVTSVADHL